MGTIISSSNPFFNIAIISSSLITRRLTHPFPSTYLSVSARQNNRASSTSPIQVPGPINFGPGLDHEPEIGSCVTFNDYSQQAAVLVSSTCDGAGPRWFTPIECRTPKLTGAPLLLYLPGFDGLGLGLMRQQQKLGRIFEVWCLHTPVMDRTPFTELVKLVEGVIKSEYSRSPKRPIYLVGESLGGCLALVIAARNPDIDLVLILANPGDIVGLLMDMMEKALGQTQAAKDLLKGFKSLSPYHPVIADILSISTILWKMELLKNACAEANSCLHAVKAQSLILTSGRDPLLPSLEEGKRLHRVLPICEIRNFDNGHFLFLEDGADLVYTIKVASFYRRGRRHDYVADYLQPSPSEFKRIQDQYWWYDLATSPVMLSTLQNGKIVRGLAGIPSEGPTLLVGYHMLMAFELLQLLLRFMTEKNIIIRTMAHPVYFHSFDSYQLFRSPALSIYEMFRLLGVAPVSGTNLFKVLASKSHGLLYPGGLREAFHRKGEEYHLFWPEQAEFVRVAARFGTKIIPFGVVGEDDIGRLVANYDDLVRIPYLKEEIEKLTNELGKLRSESSGEVSNQPLHIPGILPKVPGRFYYLFGKPIETKGRSQVLKDKQKAQELYLEVKSEVEKCLAYLKEKREHDPYRSILPRLLYMSTYGNTSEIPTFEL